MCFYRGKSSLSVYVAYQSKLLPLGWLVIVSTSQLQLALHIETDNIDNRLQFKKKRKKALTEF